MTLPQDGPLDLGAVRLPAGRRLSGWGTEPVAWVTSERVPNPGRLWSDLSRLAGETGLRPLLIRADYTGAPEFPWEQVSEEDVRGFLGFLSEMLPPEVGGGFAAVAHGDEPLLPRIQQARASAAGEDDHDIEAVFRERGEVAAIDGIDPGDVLADLWPEGADDEYLTADLSPFTKEFPGLAPATAQSLPAEAITAALDQFEPAYLALAEAARPADVITVTGWGPTDFWQEPEPLSAVLRSWEDRFGARLIQAGPSAQLRLLVERPPRTLEQALPVAAELYAFADDWFDEAHNNRSAIRAVGEIAARLVDGPIWGFWWD